MNDQDGIVLVVQDQGSGITEAHLKHLFEPFFTTKKNVGTGLGLWVVKQFLDNHGGPVKVTSSAEEREPRDDVHNFSAIHESMGNGTR